MGSSDLDFGCGFVMILNLGFLHCTTAVVLHSERTLSAGGSGFFICLVENMSVQVVSSSGELKRPGKFCVNLYYKY